MMMISNLSRQHSLLPFHVPIQSLPYLQYQIHPQDQKQIRRPINSRNTLASLFKYRTNRYK